MRAIEPLTITDALLTSSTVPEPDSSVGELAYDAMETYDTNEVVVSDHWTWRSLVDTNANPLPAVNASNDFWVSLGASNRFKAFNYLTTQQSTGASPYVIEITPGVAVGAVVLTGLVGETVQVRAIRPGDVVVYDQTVGLSDRVVTDWYEYWFEPFDVRTNALFRNIPPAPDVVIEITITGTGNVAVRNVVVGPDNYIGWTQYNGLDRALDFSTITRDQFANATLTPGRVVPSLKPPVYADKARVPTIRRLRDRVAATPVVWIGVDDQTDAYFDSHFVFGIWRQFDIDTNLPNHARVDLELENL